MICIHSIRLGEHCTGSVSDLPHVGLFLAVLLEVFGDVSARHVGRILVKATQPVPMY